MSRHILRIAFIALPAIAAFTAIGVVTAMLGIFRPAPVLVGGLALSVVFAWVSGWGRPVGSLSVPLSVLILVVVFAAGFAALNAKYSAEHLLTNRDPGVYLTTGRWLAEHDSLLIDGKPGGFEGVEDVSARSQGYYDIRDDGRLYAQFQHGLPVWIAVSHWLGGDWLMFKTNAVIGAGALITFFLLTLILLRPWFGVLATAALACNLVLLHFSRDTYSEPLALLFMFGGLWAIVIGRDHPKPGFSFVSGFVFGAAAMVRIDVWISVAFLFLYLVMVVSAAREGGDRRSWMRYVLPVGAGVLAAGSIGFADLAIASPKYLSDLSAQVRLMFLLVLAVIVLGIAIASFWQSLAPIASRLRLHRQTLANLAAAGIVGLALVLYFVRPEVQVTHRATKNGHVGSLQTLEGLDVDATRTYAEWSFRWLGWYLGVIPLAMAVAGLSGATRSAILGNARRWSAPLLVIGGTTLVYLWKPSITPDHLWAMRRFLPIVLPGMVLAAAWIVERLWENDFSDNRLKTLVRTGAIGGALLMTVVPAAFSAPLATATTQVGMYGATLDVCSRLPANAAVAIVDPYLAARYQGAMRGFCDVPVVGSVLDRQVLAELNVRWSDQGGRLFVMGDASLLDGDDADVTYRTSFSYTLPERTLMRRPDQLATERFGLTLVLADTMLEHLPRVTP